MYYVQLKEEGRLWRPPLYSNASIEDCLRFIDHDVTTNRDIRIIDDKGFIFMIGSSLCNTRLWRVVCSSQEKDHFFLVSLL
jgi:hypothetical protein